MVLKRYVRIDRVLFEYDYYRCYLINGSFRFCVQCLPCKTQRYMSRPPPLYSVIELRSTPLVCLEVERVGPR